MSSGQRPTQDNPPGADLRDAIIGGGGLALIAKLGISFIPDSFPQKRILDDMVPWFSAVAGASIVWAWSKYHNRVAKNDEESALLAAEEYYQNLILDPDIPTERRDEARRLLADLRMYRAATLSEEATGSPVASDHEQDRVRTRR